MEGWGLENVFVAHVKVGYEDRRASIEAQLQKRGIAYEFMLDKDIPDLSAADMGHFAGQMLERHMLAAVSCELKHIAIYEQIVQRNLPGALVLEDDIFLAPHFCDVVVRALEETDRRTDVDKRRLLVCFENPLLQYVPRSRRVTGQLLYEVGKSRSTGCYYLTRAAAEGILAAFHSEVIDEPIDHYQTLLANRGILCIYWCHPPVAEQGSMNGRFTSAIQPRRRAGIRRTATWAIEGFWKELVSQFR